MRFSLSQYVRNILVWLDQGINVLLLGGDEDETVSSVAGKLRGSDRKAAALCSILDRIDPRHCSKSKEVDEGANSAFSQETRIFTRVVTTLSLWLSIYFAYLILTTITGE